MSTITAEQTAEQLITATMGWQPDAYPLSVVGWVEAPMSETETLSTIVGPAERIRLRAWHHPDGQQVAFHEHVYITEVWRAVGRTVPMGHSTSCRWSVVRPGGAA